jgi:RNA polymerase sigma factor (TIGR02999 family)
MRQILVDHARGRAAQKRGGEMQRVTLGEAPDGAAPARADILDLDRALTELARTDARKSEIIELRFFGGMTVPEIASCLRTSESTINRELRVALSRLHRAMRDASP